MNHKLIALFLIPLFIFSAIPATPLFADASEVSFSETGSLVPVKTLADEPSVQAPEPEAAIEASAAFMEDAPLSQADETEEETLQTESNDTYYGTYAMWGFDRVQAEQAWALSRGAGVTIAVIDTGVDFTHEDLTGNIFNNAGEIAGDGVDNDGNGYIDDTRGWDFINNDNNATDDNGHGTHVSGIAAAVSDNGKGIAGIAPDAKILAVKVLDASGSGAIDKVIAGIRYAADMGAKVINMSLGIAKRFLSNSLLGAFQSAIDYALGKGAITIVAAGNESVDANTTAPAGLNNTIAVGATDDKNKKASFSNKNPDLVAPGVKIGSTYPGSYVYMSGSIPCSVLFTPRGPALRFMPISTPASPSQQPLLVKPVTILHSATVC
jgi:subtilisin family serine protease